MSEAPKILRAGIKLDRFVEGAIRPNSLSAEDMNVLVRGLECFLNLKVKFGQKNELHIGNDGTAILELAVSSVPGANTDPDAVVSAAQYRLKSVARNYLTCRTWNGFVEGATDIYIARNDEARSPTSEIIGSESWSYSYGPGGDSLNEYRVASNGVDTENQVVVPWYRTNEVIHAITVDHTNVSGPTSAELTKLHLSSRCWSWRRE